MRNDAVPGGLSAPSWQDALEELERALRDASWAITLLRRALEEGAQPVRPLHQPPSQEQPRAPRQPEAGREVPAMARPAKVVPMPEPAEAPAEDPGAHTTFERLWDRIERERIEKEPGEAAAPDGEEARGLDLLPQQYLMTIEDRESRVDLVPLHRALLNIAGMDDVSLVTYANGVPVISIRVQGEIDIEKLQNAVETTMDRACEVIPQENNKLFLRLRPRDEEE